MPALIDWTRALSPAHAVFAALLANTLVFLATLGIGEIIARAWKAHRVANDPPPVERREVLLALTCIVLNSGVMVAGWWLFREDVIVVDGGIDVGCLLDAALLALVMDFAMYVTHRIAHIGPAFRWVHRTHHRYEHPRPLTLFVLHPLEVLGFGGLWLAVLSTRAFSLGGIFIYLAFNVLFGVVGHVGVEPLPQRWASWPVLRRVGTSTFHARHHQLEKRNFGFYTGIWDRLFGTLDENYESTFGRPRK